jgi:hypothetical protein
MYSQGWYTDFHFYSLPHPLFVYICILLWGYSVTIRTGFNELDAISQLCYHLFCLQVYFYLSLYLFTCLFIHMHIQERIMDDFDPTNPATLSGHLKALELLGQLTARAGPARRYVRAHVAILSVPLSVSFSHAHTHSNIHGHTHMRMRTHPHPPTHTHTHTHSLSLLPALTLSLSYPHSLSLSLTRTHSLTLSLSYPHTHTHSLSLYLAHTNILHTHTHTHTLSLTLTDTHYLCPSSPTTISPRCAFSPMNKTNLTSIFRPTLISKLVDMIWPGEAIVPLAAALIEMVETENECELAVKKVQQCMMKMIVYLSSESFIDYVICIIKKYPP